MTHKITYNNKNIEFQIIRKKVKNVNLNVNAQGVVTVTAREEVPETYIYDMVNRKARWIIEQQRYFKEYRPLSISEKELVGGESIRYLGRQYRLKIVEASKEEVKYYRGYIYIFVKDKGDYERKQRLLNEWLSLKCKEIFNQLYRKYYPIVNKYHIPEVAIQTKIMKTRWGSCLPEKQLIIFNKELIKAPRYCIEYVVLHELTHLLYKNHNQDFYNFLYSIMPDWKERKRLLDEEIILNL